MTTEPEAEYVAPAPFPEAGYMQFAVPGVPYSAIRIPLVYDAGQQNVLIAHAIEAGKILLEAFNDEFGAADPVRQVEAQQRPQEGQQRESQPERGLVQGLCPQHNVRVQPSIVKYRKYEMDDEGNEVLANYFCPGKENGTGTNHTVWRREIVSG